jgi:hypothetical protein
MEVQWGIWKRYLTLDSGSVNGKPGHFTTEQCRKKLEAQSQQKFIVNLYPWAHLFCPQNFRKSNKFQ